MLIVCPACDARYAVDDALIGPAGRAVRCSDCHAEWTVRPREASPADRIGDELGGATGWRAVGSSIALVPAEPTARDDADPGDAPLHVTTWEAGPRDHALASTLEAPRARRGGGAFLAGFVLATMTALLAALAYLRAEDLAVAAPAVAPQIEAYSAWVDALRADVAAALAAAR